ncbi:hypothetical protein [Lysobacter gummosus]|uniref:hypothetical protein n=1 Tax=Lysobacter gummosus TaxID=262324 RepID=UPI00363A7546
MDGSWGERMRLRAKGSRIRERQGGQPWPGSLTNRERSRLTSEHRVFARTIYRDEAKGSRIRERQGATRPGQAAKTSKRCRDRALDPRLRGDDGLKIRSAKQQQAPSAQASSSAHRAYAASSSSCVCARLALCALIAALSR